MAEMGESRQELANLLQESGYSTVIRIEDGERVGLESLSETSREHTHYHVF
jgi:hypothetical protein